MENSKSPNKKRKISDQDIPKKIHKFKYDENSQLYLLLKGENIENFNMLKEYSKIPLSIDLSTLTSANLPSDWPLKSAAARAGKASENFGRFMGYIKLEFFGVSLAKLNELVRENYDEFVHNDEVHALGFNIDGEYPTPSGQIPISRLIDSYHNSQIKTNKSDLKLLNHVMIYKVFLRI